MIKAIVNIPVLNAVTAAKRPANSSGWIFILLKI